MRVLENKRTWSPDMWTNEVLKARRDEDWKSSFSYSVRIWAFLCASTVHTHWNVTLSKGLWYYTNHTTRHLLYISRFLLVWLNRPMGTKASSCPRLIIFCADRWLWTEGRTVLGPRTMQAKTNEAPEHSLILQMKIKRTEPGSEM
jgi:hypothetical protein